MSCVTHMQSLSFMDKGSLSKLKCPLIAFTIFFLTSNTTGRDILDKV